MVALTDTYPEEFETEEGLETLEIPDDVLEELRTGQHMRMVQAVKEQQYAAAVAGERRNLPYGEVNMQIHPVIFHYWGQRLGYECWDDKQFCREMCRDNPELRVRSISDKVMVGFAPSKSKFHKKYDWPENGNCTV